MTTTTKILLGTLIAVGGYYAYTKIKAAKVIQTANGSAPTVVKSGTGTVTGIITQAGGIVGALSNLFGGSSTSAPAVTTPVNSSGTDAGTDDDSDGSSWDFGL